MSHMCLTSLQKCNRAQWQMLFHPTTLTLEFWNPLTFEQMCISRANCDLTGWTVTQKTLLFIHDSSVTPSPSQQYFSLIGPDKPPIPVLPGPEIVFRPVYKKSSAHSGKCSANFTKTSMQYTPTESIRNEGKVFHVSESVSGPLSKEDPSEHSSALYNTIWQKFSHQFFWSL